MFNIRAFEKTDKMGFLFFISYNGKKFDSFDENKDNLSVKGEFIKYLTLLGFSWAKGIQQAGRTDAEVSAAENVLYCSSKYFGDLDRLQLGFNKMSKYLKIKRIVKTLPNLELPNYVERRIYRYKYPKEKILFSSDDILKRCQELTGKYDMSEFTDYKGKKLKEQTREVILDYINGDLRFNGNSFLPKQVRIMSGYVLTGEKKILPGKYLTLEKIVFNQFLNLYLCKDENLEIELVEKVEKLNDNLIFYVKKENKGQILGNRGKNIKKLKKKFGNIIIKQI